MLLAATVALSACSSSGEASCTNLQRRVDQLQRWMERDASDGQSWDDVSSLQTDERHAQWSWLQVRMAQLGCPGYYTSA